MKLLKRILGFVVVLIVLILLAMLIIPYFFKDKLVVAVKTEINEYSEATIDFDDVNLSFFRSFPNLTLTLDELGVQTPMEAPDDHLAKVNSFSLTIDLMSLLNQNDGIQINSVNIDNPKLFIIVDKEGKANYEYLMSSDTNDEPSSFSFDLESYTISDADLRYIDRLTDSDYSIKDLNHSGSGQFSDQEFLLDTQTEIAAITIDQSGINFLDEAKLLADIELKVSDEMSQYEIKTAEISLNALNLATDGNFRIEEDSYEMDLNINAPNNSLKELISIIPGAFTEDFSDVKANGDINMSGMVNGRYLAEKSIYPKFQFVINGSNGKVQYPDLPSSIDNIDFDIHVDQMTDNLANTILDIRKLHFDVEDSPFDVKMKVTELFDNPHFNMQANGLLDLSKIARAFPIESITSMSGKADFDIALDANQNAIMEMKSDEVKLEGKMDISDLSIDQTTEPDISIKKLNARIDNNIAALHIDQLRMGKSDLTAKGNIINPMGIMAESMPIDGQLVMSSQVLNVNEWYDEDAIEQDSQAVYDIEYPLEQTKMSVDYRINQLQYEDYTMADVVAVGRIDNNSFLLEEARLKKGDSDLNASGKLDNIWGYGLADETLTGNINIESEQLVLDDFMTTVASDSDELAAQEVVLIPDNVDVNITAQADQLRYEKIELKDVSGNLTLADEIAQMSDVKAKGLGGQMNLAGAYNTQNAQKPKFDFSYNLSELQFTKMTESIASFAILAPIAKFIEGIFNSTLKLSGELKPDLFPDFNTLTGAGFLETTQGQVKGFKPLEKVNALLNFTDDSRWNIKDSRNWFEIENGAVAVKEFDLSVQGIDFKISGSHKINQDMDYLLKTKVPRAILNKSKAGQLANQGVNSLLNAINKAGVDLGNSEFVNVNIELTGNLLSPKIKVIPVGASGRSYTDEAQAAAREIVEDVKDSAKTVIKNEREKLENTAKEKAQELSDTVEQVVNEKIKEVKDQVEQDVKDKSREVIGEVGDTLVGEIGKKAEDILGDKAKDVKNEAKDRLKGLFGKKKKDDGGND